MGKRVVKAATEPENTCQFCQIVAGEVRASIVFEDPISVAFLDHRPLFPGHCLLVAKQHFATLLDLPTDMVGPFFLNAQMLTRTVQRAMQAEGTFVAMNNVVSQSVPHFHLHIVPRRRGDGLRGFFWPRHKVTDEELKAVQRTIASALKSSLK